MKKVLFFLFLSAFIPAVAFAQLQVGGVAMYKGDPTNVTSITASSFTFGGEARLRLGIFQGAVSALYIPYGSYSAIAALTDVGVSFDAAVFSFGAGIGPNFAINIGDLAPNPVSFGMNLKVTADVNIGFFSIGLAGFYYVSDFTTILSVFQRLPWLGITALVKI
jgi:hypothetical protein